VCRLQGAQDDLYYYSTTFSGGPGVRHRTLHPAHPPLTNAYSGVFDTPRDKCPPDIGGSSDWVRASPAPPAFLQYSPASSTRSLSPFLDTHSATGIVFPPTPPLDAADAFLAPVPPASFGLDAPATPPRAIPRARVDDAPPTPPLTPEDDGPLAETRAPVPAADDAFDLLSTLFPKDGLRALPHARKVSIAAPELGAAFEGVVLALPGEPKTFYVDGKSAASVNLRER
jgi:hypothetical protein